MAVQCVAQMRIDESPCLLGRMVKEMIAAGRYGAVEIGFLTAVATMAMR